MRQWNRLDLTVTARPRPGLTFQGGTSSGWTTTDVCDIVDDLPEIRFGARNLADANANVSLPESYCRQQSKVLTDFKMLGTYTVPRVDVRWPRPSRASPDRTLSATTWRPMRRCSRRSAVRCQAAPPTSRSTSSSRARCTAIAQNQLQLRVAKIWRFGGKRATASIDVYKVLNSNTVLLVSPAFATWQRPESIPNPRWVKIGLQYDF